MYESYLQRVDHWMQDAPAQDWTKAYDKESYSKAYVCVLMPARASVACAHGANVLLFDLLIDPVSYTKTKTWAAHRSRSGTLMLVWFIR